MTAHRRTVVVGVILMAGLLAAAVPSTAEVIFRCPGYEPGNVDLNGDGMLRTADGELTGLDARPNVVCMHIASGDGFTLMPDRPTDPMYIFGFNNVTGVLDQHVLKMWDAPVNPGGVLGAENPAPTIDIREGEEFYLTLTNVGMTQRPDLFDPHTVHFHGFPNASAVFDGLPESGISINMGSSLTYYYNIVEEGTFMYHCHVEATEHMQMGMLGNLWVRPAQDGTPFGGCSGGPCTQFAYNDGDGETGYDVAYPIQIGSFDPNFHDASRDVQPLPFADMRDLNPMLNGRGYPDTLRPDEDASLPRQLVSSRITANAGDRILLRLSNLNVTRYYTVSVLGIPMTVVGNGSKILRGGGEPAGQSIAYGTNSVTLGGGESMDVILDTNGVAAGTYFLYTTNVNYLNNNQQDFGGMMTEIELF